MVKNLGGGGRPPGVGRYLLVNAVVLASWLAAFLAAALLEYAPHASLWFPPAAITFATILVLGPRFFPVLWLACLIATWLVDRMYQQGHSVIELLASGVGFAVAHTLAFGSVALVLRERARQATPVTTLRKVSLFLLWGAVASGLSALFGGLALAVTGMIAFADLPRLIAPWWIGDYAGLISIAPLFGLFLANLSQRLGIETPQGARRFSRQRSLRELWPSALLKLMLLIGFSAVVLMAAATFPQKEPLLFLLFVSLILQLWIVHTESELASLLGIAGFSFLAALSVATLGLESQALLLQFVVISVAASSYLGLAVPALYRDNDRLRQMMTYDTLTGALTRSFFEDAARAGMSQARQQKDPACLIMVDLDGLKPINDRHGHAAGDQALQIVAHACARNLGPGQFLGRLSGDEFAMFLGGCGVQEAHEVVEAVQSDIADNPPVAGVEAVGASFGIAELDSTVGTYASLLDRADQAMYRHKRRD